jgi:hypothetical protein
VLVKLSAVQKTVKLLWVAYLSLSDAKPMTRGFGWCLLYQVEHLHPGRPPLRSSTDLSRRTRCLCNSIQDFEKTRFLANSKGCLSKNRSHENTNGEGCL